MSDGTKGGFLQFLQSLFTPATPTKKEAPSRDKRIKKVAAKPNPATKPKAPPPAAPAEAPGEAPPHERPPADREKVNPKEKAAPSVYTPTTPENPDRKA
jgi:hypothetical protein